MSCDGSGISQYLKSTNNTIRKKLRVYTVHMNENDLFRHLNVHLDIGLLNIVSFCC